ncbi:uncharacterized, partial [Tachysurus ichikawai]
LPFQISFSSSIAYSCTELPPISQCLLFVQAVLSSLPPPPSSPSSSAFRGVRKTCCVCQSSSNFEGRKLITGNESILHRVTTKKRERLFFLLLPIAQERLPSCKRRAVILLAPLLQNTSLTRLAIKAAAADFWALAFPGHFGNLFSICYD